MCDPRLKVKKNLVSLVAQRPLTPDLWDVTLEKSQGSSHDLVSIFCRHHGIHKHPHKYLIFSVCLSMCNYLFSYQPG